jgi:Kef-type K+ transport system membrane component KefB
MSDDPQGPIPPPPTESTPPLPSAKAIRRARRVLTLSFVVTSLFWASLSFWLLRGFHRAAAIAASCVFILAMAAMHFIGYRIWRDQLPDGTAAIRAACKTGLIVWIVLGVLTSLMLDGGYTARLFMLVSVGYLAFVVMVQFRRAAAPTAIDLLFIRYGALPLLLAAPWLATAVYYFIGDNGGYIARLFQR